MSYVLRIEWVGRLDGLGRTVVFATELLRGAAADLRDWELGGAPVAFVDRPRKLDADGQPRFDLLAFALHHDDRSGRFVEGAVVGLLPPEGSDQSVDSEVAWALVEHAIEELRTAPASADRAVLASEVDELLQRARRGDTGALDGLVRVFLPTSEWDDAGGSQALGNSVARALSAVRLG